jgi:hypothetical protein
VLSFGLQYPLATTKAWLNATLLIWGFEQCLFEPLKIWFFAVTLPGLIRGKLRRLRHPKPAVGSFPFRTPMRDSAAEYLAARHAHLPIARFLLHRQGHNAGVPGKQLTSPHPAGPADVPTAALHTAGASPLPSAAPSTAPMLDELLHLGDAHRDGGDHGDARSAITGRARTHRARSRRLRRRTCGTTLALVALSLVMFMPATLQGIIVEEAIVVLVSFGMVAALAAASIARLFAAAWGELVHAHGAAAVAAPLAAAAALLAAWIIVRTGRAHHRAEQARRGNAVDAEMHCCEAGLWCWPAARGRTANAALVSLVGSHGTPSRTHGLPSVQVEPA